MNCPFCEDSSIKNRTVIENAHAIAFPTNIHIVQGHLLIAPKRHVQYYEDATQEEKQAIEELRLKLKIAMKREFGAQGFNYAWNEEKIGGQSVPHFHLHMLRRIEGDQGVYQYEPREFLYRPGPRTITTPTDDLDPLRVRKLADAIKS
jgi:diadenosine tetraphosphate (Ap4A) HIT family hydrolase